MATGRLSTSVAVGIFFCYFSLHKTAASVEKSVLEVQKLKLTFEAVDPENV